jgi:hypothetical protein
MFINFLHGADDWNDHATREAVVYRIDPTAQRVENAARNVKNSFFQIGYRYDINVTSRARSKQPILQGTMWCNRQPLCSLQY